MKNCTISLLIVLAGSAGLLSAADDPFTAVRAALAGNQLETAEAALAPLVAGEKPDPQACLYLSQVRARQRRTKEAVSLAEKAVAGAPDQPGFHSYLGSVLGQRIGEVNFVHQALLAARMLEAFNKSIELDPEHLAGYIGLTRYYTQAPSIAGGGREPAERYALEVEKRDLLRGTLERARIAERFDDPTEARALYVKAAALQPNDASIQESLGRVSEALTQPDEARRYYEKALVLDPNSTRAQSALDRIVGAKG